MRRFLLLLILVLPLAAAEPLLSTTFAAPVAPVAPATPSACRLDGVLPVGWAEDSSRWAQVEAGFTALEEEGTAFLRVHTRSLGAGRLQLCTRLPDQAGTSFYRLRLRARDWSRTQVQLGVRRRGEPFDFLWSVSPQLGSDWADHEWLFQIDGAQAGIGVWLNIGSPGRIDLVRLSLERLDRDQLAAEIEARHPDGGPANLLRTTRFPLGLAHGWMIDRNRSDGDEVTVAADPAVTGPSGEPALRLGSTSSFPRLLSEPFSPLVPTRLHRVSLAVRGEGQVTLAVLADGVAVAHKQAAAGDTWQRVAVDFQPSLMTGSYQFQVSGPGRTLWIDAPQAGPVGRGDGWTAPAACEVALGLPPSAADAARIQFHDELAQVRWRVCGQAGAGAQLRATATDLYGATTPLPAAPASAGAGAFDFTAACTARPWGAWRIEAWVERDGARISPVAELVVNRLRRPRHWGADAPDSPFGVHTLATTRHLLMSKAAGVDWVRLHDSGLEYIGWWNLEAERGKWTFHDDEIRRYRRHNLMILGELGTAPGWASYYQGSGVQASGSFGYFDKFFQPRDLADYARYVAVVGERYKGVIDHWDVWNEPWISEWWAVRHDPSVPGRGGYRTSAEPQKDFAALQKVAHDTVRRVNPQAVVVGLNTTSADNRGSPTRISGTVWSQGVIAHGGLDTCQAVGYHHYLDRALGAPGDGLTAELAVGIAPVRARDPQRPIWMTEGSAVAANPTPGTGLYRLAAIQGGGEDNWRLSADRLCKYLVGLRANGVAKWFLYSMHCHNGTRQSKFTVLVTHDGYLHPSGIAHANLAWQMGGKRFVRSHELAPGLWAWLFEGGGEALVALSSVSTPARRTTLALNGPGELLDLFGNPPAGEAAFDGSMWYAVAEGVGAEALLARIQVRN
ncbi:MAG: hypothetical protein L6R48_20345 [Planctomycetes bacterium]|nr:hypothetical protein [Planctomycetota bacterium]